MLRNSFLVVLVGALAVSLVALACGDGSDSGTPATTNGGSTQAVEEATAATTTEHSELGEYRSRAGSDDAASVEEALFHGMARAAVIQNIEPNSLGVGGERFRVKRNPTPPGGAFVYDPRERFQGTLRFLVWWVPLADDAAPLDAYPLNSPSKLVTPNLEFPARAGVLDPPDANAVVSYVFLGQPMPTQTPVVSRSRGASPASTQTFTVREYRIYRALIDTPMSVSEEVAYRRIARDFNTTPEEAQRITERVQGILFRNRWLGTPAQEIRRASDWEGESR